MVEVFAGPGGVFDGGELVVLYGTISPAALFSREGADCQSYAGDDPVKHHWDSYRLETVVLS